MKQYKKFLYGLLGLSLLISTAVAILSYNIVGANINTIFSDVEDWKYHDKTVSDKSLNIVDIKSKLDDFTFKTVTDVKVDKYVNAIYLSFRTTGEDNLIDVKEEVANATLKLVENNEQLLSFHIEFFVYRDVVNKDDIKSDDESYEVTNNTDLQLLFYGTVVNQQTKIIFI